MKPFRVVTGVAAPLPLANVDTDTIIREQHAQGARPERPRRGLVS
jgi:3-isopropylmalate dehydratase small subunit